MARKILSNGIRHRVSHCCLMDLHLSVTFLAQSHVLSHGFLFLSWVAPKGGWLTHSYTQDKTTQHKTSALFVRYFLSCLVLLLSVTFFVNLSSNLCSCLLWCIKVYSEQDFWIQFSFVFPLYSYTTIFFSSWFPCSYDSFPCRYESCLLMNAFLFRFSSNV